jgi:hypothetical protein
MASALTIVARDKSKQSPDSFIEFVRLKGDHVFDEVYVSTIKHHVHGVEVKFEYSRHDNRLRDLPAVVISAQDWAQSRLKADVPGTVENKRQALATTPFALRLFAEGSRHFNEQVKTAEQDFLADASFLSSIGHGSDGNTN